MAYATVAELRDILPQVAAGADNDALLGAMLNRATAIVNGRLGFEFGEYAAAVSAKDVRNVGHTQYLELPGHQQGSVTTVYYVYSKAEDSEDATDEIDDFSELDDGRLWRNQGWGRGQWYRVTALWGYGPPPDEVIQVTLEVAVNLWGARDSRQISDVIGVEGGGAVGYQRALTNRQRMVLDDVRAGYLGGVVHA